MLPKQIPASLSLILVLLLADHVRGSETEQKYYAHEAKHDEYGVIAPWFGGQNGQLDFRIRVAAETLKRYPWTDRKEAIDSAPHFMFNGQWKIDDDGTITPMEISNWQNGDLGQRSAYVLAGLVDYYRYSGDPAAISLMTIQANLLLDYCLTPSSHSWPQFPITVPVAGKPYGRCDPRGIIQLDIAAELGLAMLRAYQVTGEKRWLEACQHWGTLMARNRSRASGSDPWKRYTVPTKLQQDNKQTGGVVFLLYFFDELIRLGHHGANGEITAARDAGRRYLRDKLLDQWTVNDTWGRNYWDWANPVQAENVTEFTARYLMDNPDQFPNWRVDARNVLSLFLNRTSVDPTSNGGVFSGAWAFPESSSCCGRSLWYGPMELAVAFSQYGERANSAWGRELARRMQILATYDGHPTGVSEDNIDGGFVVNNEWFKIAHPMALKHLLGTLEWLPGRLGPARENHIMRSSAVVQSVIYSKGRVEYRTFDAPDSTVTLLRLAFLPERVSSGDQILKVQTDLSANGYRIRKLDGGDALVWIRHDKLTTITVTGDDPQEQVDDSKLSLSEGWSAIQSTHDFENGCHLSSQAGATFELSFNGNQVRVLGRCDPNGGLADIYIDGEKQLAAIDCWAPSSRYQQVLYYRSGLSNGAHRLKLVVNGEQNARSNGSRVYVDGVQFSAAEADPDWGSGGGPTGPQRLVMGYVGRDPIRDSNGDLWFPGTEFTVRMTQGGDSVSESWWTKPTSLKVLGTEDAELYRYGSHYPKFDVHFTVGPGTYFARLKFAENQRLNSVRNCVSVAINGQQKLDCLDVTATAGGPHRACDITFNDLKPRNGEIHIALSGGNRRWGQSGEAFLQAIEIGPGTGAPGSTPVTLHGKNLLSNAGFEFWEYRSTAPSAPADWHVERGAESKIRFELNTRSDRLVGLGHTVVEGKRALRTRGIGTFRLAQQIAVLPGERYRAGVLSSVRKGVGTGATGGPPTASLIVEELDKESQVIARHNTPLSLDPKFYKYCGCEFTTTPETTFARYTLTAQQHSFAEAVLYDQCVLDGQPALGRIFGTVTDRAGRPLVGITIRIDDRNTRTGADGQFSFDGFIHGARVTVKSDHKQYYPLVQRVRVKAPETRCDFVLVRVRQ